MDDFYMFVLKKCNWDDEKFAHDYPIVLGAISISQPLCVAVWDGILSPLLNSSVKYMLDELVPLLLRIAVPRMPIRFVHQSFRSFITDQAGSLPSGLRHYAVDAWDACANMAMRCIGILREGLGLIRDLWREIELPRIPSETLSEHFRCAVVTSFIISIEFRSRQRPSGGWFARFSIIT
ncbi:uncharacterized protein EI90DRAFT_2634552 [Cantharellus anzutake]|uniref:uncharacterized protein n=1 Tax=Cantharellus anzutake TaxID=1750568 RepID=UPI001904233A|nr:uncharacterized protein EI90DRAFT_2634552 [Cantharellus anzutake]KAF8319516.1 hypothetical protein EI90DRAFT_2634552 [Cantharellus anzutake]